MTALMLLNVSSRVSLSVARFFLIRMAVSRAGGDSYQHSSMTLRISPRKGSVCQKLGISGRNPSTQTTLRISSTLGSGPTTSL